MGLGTVVTSSVFLTIVVVRVTLLSYSANGPRGTPKAVEKA